MVQELKIWLLKLAGLIPDTRLIGARRWDFFGHGKTDYWCLDLGFVAVGSFAFDLQW